MKRKLTIVTGVLILLLAGIKWAWHLPQYMDVTFGDEAQYLRYGIDLFGVIKKDWGPSYNIWYKLLSFFNHNVIGLFYLNYQATAILLAIALFIFLIRYNIAFVIGLWLSFCFLLSTTVIDTWPRVSHFAVIVLLIFLIVVRNIKLNAKKMLLLTLAFYIAAYARPELFSSFVLISLVTLYFLFRERESFKSWMPLMILVASIILLNFMVYQLPANTYKGIDRTYIAFSQHYAINYVIEHKAHFNPISEWIDFTHKTFGSCPDFGCILKTHTDLVIHNSLLNLKHYALTLMQFIISILFPVKIIGNQKIQFFVFAGFICLIAAIVFFKSNRQKFIAQVKQHSLLLLVLFLFGLPSMGTSVLIFPRQHYLLMHSVLLIFLVAMVINSLPIIDRVKDYYVLVIFIPLLIKSPTAKKYNYYQVEKENKNHCNRCLVEYLTTHNDGMPHTVFSNHLSLSMLLPHNFNDFNTEYEYKPGMEFKTILREKKIDYIVIREILLNEKLINSDTTWTNFLRDPVLYQFKKQSYCDSCDSYLLVKEKP
jgi:hypothetical protein